MGVGSRRRAPSHADFAQRFVTISSAQAMGASCSVVATQDVQSFIDPTPVLPSERCYRASQTLNP